MRYFEVDKYNNNILVCFGNKDFLIIVDDDKKNEFNLLVAGYLRREYSEVFPIKDKP